MPIALVTVIHFIFFTGLSIGESSIKKSNPGTALVSPCSRATKSSSPFLSEKIGQLPGTTVAHQRIICWQDTILLIVNIAIVVVAVVDIGDDIWHGGESALK